ncbi:MAG: sigma-54-dependent Fis family transcriptional regulator [Vicinamibacteria bacterium]|nr:sigma-54-dependent Fis family transcriptional regulator [Vicinamibacteria bacterium]
MSRSTKIRVLIVEDDEVLNEILQDEMKERGHEPSATAGAVSAYEALGKRPFDVAVLDLMLPDGSGLDVIKWIAEQELPTECIVLTGHATVPTAIEAMRLGAYDYVIKPTSMDELDALVRKAAEKSLLRRENVSLKTQVERLKPVEGMITNDPAMQEILKTVARSAPSTLPILIMGETGTGKELVARAVHRMSARAGNPFIVVSCAAVPESLLESELFGHERGAFTGAIERKPGLFEVADGGVLFLDEIGDVPAAFQVKLLRAIETGEFFRVGGTRSILADVRIVAATNKNLREEVREGHFREDLYHRLNGVAIRLPALRERKGDIPLLAVHFLDQVRGARKQISPEALEFLQSYSWPGNVRELLMIVHRAAILSKEDVIQPRDLPLDPWDWRTKGVFSGLTLAEMEKEYIATVLDQHQGHRGKAAEALGIDPKTLYNKLGPRESEKPG